MFKIIVTEDVKADAVKIMKVLKHFHDFSKISAKFVQGKKVSLNRITLAKSIARLAREMATKQTVLVCYDLRDFKEEEFYINFDVSDGLLVVDAPSTEFTLNVTVEYNKPNPPFESLYIADVDCIKKGLFL